MKYRTLALLTLFAVVMLAVCPTEAAQRTVVCEAFTQWNCGPCAGWNPTELRVLEAMTRDTVISIKYHVSWPAPNNDIFYLWNTTEVDARRNYYGVSSVPVGYVDGVLTITRSESGFRNQVRSRANIPAPCEIELAAQVEGPTSVSFSGTVFASDSSIVNKRLFVALITDRVEYASSPGLNGEVLFYDIFRDLWPSTNGQTISIAFGASYEFSGTLNKDATWPNSGMSIVCWIQDNSSKWTHQGAWAPVLNLWQVNTSSGDPRQLVADVNAETTYSIQLTNAGANNDVYTVSLPNDLPAGWTATIEATSVPADPTSISVPLSSEQSTVLTLRAWPNGHGGNAVLTVDVQSDGNAETQAAETFRLMAGLDVLLVDDDGGATWGNVENYYLDALEAVGGDFLWGWWDMTEDQALDALDLNGLDAVIWFTGSSPNNGTLDFLEQYLLEVYLTSGNGRLFLTGQGIAWDLRTSSFLSEILHVSHVQPYAQGRDILGIASDPIGDGLSFNISQSGGAQNQTRQSSIAAYDELAHVVLDYSGAEHHAGVAAETPDYRAVFFGFGFEAISSAAARDTVMTRVMNWLLGAAAADPLADLPLPTEFALGQNFPNPFNPQTTIPFALPARAELTLRVFDVLGREVDALAAGAFNAGYHTLTWDASRFGSGVYFYRLDALAGDRSFQATRKLMLLK